MRSAVESGRPLRIGFVSRFYDAHIIAECTRGLLAELDRQRFETFVFHACPVEVLAGQLAASADHVIAIDNRPLAAMRERIAVERLDILVYSDIGMEPTTYFLAFARLAPVQCVIAGHPVTTGIPNVDYFLSCDYFEPVGAEDHYSEQLIRFNDPPLFFYRPTTPQPDPVREMLGLAPDSRLYACPQSLYKLHPDFDDLVGRILRKDPSGRLVLVSETDSYHADVWRQRLTRTYGDIIDRIDFVPRMPYATFCNFLRSVDALLDPVHFGGGTTSLAAFAMGVPVITLASRFMRGRVTSGCYERMGVTDAIAHNADDYVAKALRCAQDPEWRRTVGDRLAEQCDVLFENTGVMADVMDFFAAAVTAARTGALLAAQSWPPAGQPALVNV